MMIATPISVLLGHNCTRVGIGTVALFIGLYLSTVHTDVHTVFPYPWSEASLFLIWYCAQKILMMTTVEPKLLPIAVHTNYSL